MTAANAHEPQSRACEARAHWTPGVAAPWPGSPGGAAEVSPRQRRTQIRAGRVALQTGTVLGRDSASRRWGLCWPPTDTTLCVFSGCLRGRRGGATAEGTGHVCVRTSQPERPSASGPQKHGSTGPGLPLGAPVSPLPTRHHAPSTVRDTFEREKQTQSTLAAFLLFFNGRKFLKNWWS